MTSGLGTSYPTRPFSRALVGACIIEIATTPGLSQVTIACRSAGLSAHALRFARRGLGRERLAALGAAVANDHRQSVASMPNWGAFPATRWITMWPRRRLGHAVEWISTRPRSGSVEHGR